MTVLRGSSRRLALVAALAATAAVAGAQIAGAARRTTPIGTGVVVVDTNLSYQGASAAGTGMVLTPTGEVLTNNHVVRGATSIRVVDPRSGRRWTATVAGYDIAADVAVLQLQGASGLRTVSPAPAERLRRGQAVTALGNANGAGRLTLAPGRVVGLGRSITAQGDQGVPERLTGLIQTDALLQPGDSGGPLLDAAHRVVGMDTAAAAGFAFQSAVGESYAIPIGRALAIARQIVAGQASAAVHVGATPFLGLSIDPSGTGGALVVAVVPGGPADQAGIVAGDVITSLAGRPVGGASALGDLVLQQTPDASVAIAWTDTLGRPQTGTVTLASGPPQ